MDETLWCIVIQMDGIWDEKWSVAHRSSWNGSESVVWSHGGMKCPFWWWWPSWWHFWWQCHQEEGHYLWIVNGLLSDAVESILLAFSRIGPSYDGVECHNTELQTSRTWLGLYYLSQMTSTVVRNIAVAYISRIYCLCSPTTIVYHQWLSPDICKSDLCQPWIHWCLIGYARSAVFDLLFLTHSCMGMPQGLQALSSSSKYIYVYIYIYICIRPEYMVAMKVAFQSV